MAQGQHGRRQLLHERGLLLAPPDVSGGYAMQRRWGRWQAPGRQSAAIAAVSCVQAVSMYAGACLFADDDSDQLIAPAQQVREDEVLLKGAHVWLCLLDSFCQG